MQLLASKHSNKNSNFLIYSTLKTSIKNKTQFSFGGCTEKKDVQKNKLLLKEFLQLDDIFFLDQVHGNKVVEYKKSKLIQQGDASFSTKKNIALAIITADCLPVFLTDNKTWIGAAHCGNKSLFGGILKNLVANYPSDPKNLIAYFAPTISQNCYEVDNDFTKKFIAKNLKYKSAFIKKSKLKYQMSLHKIAKQDLFELGIFNIQNSKFCTFKNDTLFYSYRKNNITGRNAHFIYLTK